MTDPELRVDPLTGASVLVAPGRASRPGAFHYRPVEPGTADGCPFCAGREQDTPREVWADRPASLKAHGPGWRVRAVPNKYPVLGTPGRVPPTDPDGALLSGRPAVGACEVIVHVPDHRTTLGSLTEDELSRAVAGWRKRMSAHSDAAQVQLIVNEGHDAGSSLEHTHAQLYGLPFVPAGVEQEQRHAAAYRERTDGCCLVCDLVQQELRADERVVLRGAETVLIAPYASKLPFHMQIFPLAHSPRFEESAGGAELLGEALRRLRARTGEPPPLNIWVRNPPNGVTDAHWRVDLLPRLTVPAGLEFSTDLPVCAYSPERAAAELANV